VDPDYWTDAMTYVEVSVLEQEATGEVGAPRWSSGWGEVAVIEKVVGYKKIKFFTHENAGYGDVRLPEMQMHTTAFWITVPESVCVAFVAGRAAAIEGLRAVGVALETMAALALMCDPRDLGVTLGDAPDAQGLDAPQQPPPRKERGGPVPGFNPTLFVYEHVPGGTGLAERIWEQRDVLLARALRMIESCSCPSGCPSCIGPGDIERKGAALDLLLMLVPSA
jgi:DEAD/DEAH box helicase domain-containing protein